MKYKHIVFDIDGTLIDTEYAVLHSLQETIKGLSGREIPCSELRFFNNSTIPSNILMVFV